MNFLKTFEDRVAGIFGAARAPFSFKKLAKQAAREMEDQTLVVNGVNTAPALYTILIANDDDPLMAPYYPQLSSEVSEFVKAQAEKKHYTFVGEPLVRFMIDPSLRGGKFSVFAENVDAPTLGRLYEEERAYQNGISAPMPRQQAAPQPQPQQFQPQQPAPAAPAPMIDQVAAAPQQDSTPEAGDPFAVNPDSSFEVDPFEPASLDPVDPIPVPQTMSREALAGLGGAAATGGALGAAAGLASNVASARQPQTPQAPMAQLVDLNTGEVRHVTQSRCTIGRERSAADLVVSDPNVSRRHAELTFTGSDWTLEDLNSTNGTFVNNRRIMRCPLRDGDVLTFGLSKFEFRS